MGKMKETGGRWENREVGARTVIKMRAEESTCWK